MSTTGASEATPTATTPLTLARTMGLGALIITA